MIKLKELLNEKTVSMGQVHSNPYASSFKSPEQIKEDGHTDVPSAIRKLKTSIEDANEILNKLNSMSKEESLPSWWSDKITLSANYLNKSRDYILNTNEKRNTPFNYIQLLNKNPLQKKSETPLFKGGFY